MKRGNSLSVCEFPLVDMNEHQSHLLSTLVRAQVEAQFCLKMKPWGHLFQNWGDLIEFKSTLCASSPDQTLPRLSSSPLSGLSWAGTRHTSSLHCLTQPRRFASQRNPKPSMWKLFDWDHTANKPGSPRLKVSSLWQNPPSDHENPPGATVIKMQVRIPSFWHSSSV